MGCLGWWVGVIGFILTTLDVDEIGLTLCEVIKPYGINQVDL